MSQTFVLTIVSDPPLNSAQVNVFDYLTIVISIDW
jgi:hypothetical protein